MGLFSHALLPDYIRLKKSLAAKRYTLKINQKERCVDLIMPKRGSADQAYHFAMKHKDWIAQKLSALPEAISFNHGTIISIMGEAITIDIIQDTNRKTTDIKLEDGILRVKTNLDLKDVGQRITRFLKKLAKQSFAEMAQEKAETISKDIKSVSVRDTTSRWGSCSQSGNLSFSWRLIFAPFETIDYVIAHEVAHLEHLNHSPDFWNLCEDLSQEYTKGKRWIKKNGQELMRYGA